MFTKTVEVDEAFQGTIETYQSVWDEVMDVGSVNDEALLVPQYGWHQGLFYDGPIVWRGQVLVPRGGPTRMQLSSKMLELCWFKPDEFQVEPRPHHFLNCLRWSVCESLGVWPGGALPVTQVQLDQSDLESALKLVILRQAYMKAEFCFTGKPASPAWRRLFQNLNVRFQKGLSGFESKKSICLDQVFPKIRGSLLPLLVQEANRRSEVIPALLIRES